MKEEYIFNIHRISTKIINVHYLMFINSLIYENTFTKYINKRLVFFLKYKKLKYNIFFS